MRNLGGIQFYIWPLHYKQFRYHDSAPADYVNVKFTTRKLFSLTRRNAALSEPSTGLHALAIVIAALVGAAATVAAAFVTGHFTTQAGATQIREQHDTILQLRAEIDRLDRPNLAVRRDETELKKERDTVARLQSDLQRMQDTNTQLRSEIDTLKTQISARPELPSPTSPASPQEDKGTLTGSRVRC